MRSRCLIEVSFPDEKSAGAALKAVSHEGEIGNRSNVKMSVNGSDLRLEIESQDTVAMRATANAFLRALQVFEDIGVRK